MFIGDQLMHRKWRMSIIDYWLIRNGLALSRPPKIRSIGGLPLLLGELSSLVDHLVAEALLAARGAVAGRRRAVVAVAAPAEAPAGGVLIVYARHGSLVFTHCTNGERRAEGKGGGSWVYGEGEERELTTTGLAPESALGATAGAVGLAALVAPGRAVAGGARGAVVVARHALAAAKVVAAGAVAVAAAGLLPAHAGRTAVRVVPVGLVAVGRGAVAHAVVVTAVGVVAVGVVGEGIHDDGLLWGDFSVGG